MRATHPAIFDNLGDSTARPAYVAQSNRRTTVVIHGSPFPASQGPTSCMQGATGAAAAKASEGARLRAQTTRFVCPLFAVSNRFRLPIRRSARPVTS